MSGPRKLGVKAALFGFRHPISAGIGSDDGCGASLDFWVTVKSHCELVSCFKVSCRGGPGCKSDDGVVALGGGRRLWAPLGSAL